MRLADLVDLADLADLGGPGAVAGDEAARAAD